MAQCVFGAGWPDTVKIVFVHSSVGAGMLSGGNSANDYSFKYYLDSIAKNNSSNVLTYSFRANTPQSSEYAGFKGADFDITIDYWLDNAGGLGTKIKDHFNYSQHNMYPDHITAIFADTSNFKEEFLGNTYDIYDSVGDSVYLTDSYYDILWVKTSYFPWENMADSIGSYRAQFLAIRDSMATHYTEKIFILGFGSSTDLGTTRPAVSSADVDSCMILNTWVLDTLCDKSNYPNFYVLSFYDMLVDKDTESATYGFTPALWSDGGTNHPNQLGSIEMLEQSVIWWDSVYVEILDYWDGTVGGSNMSGILIPSGNITIE